MQTSTLPGHVKSNLLQRIFRLEIALASFLNSSCFGFGDHVFDTFLPIHISIIKILHDDLLQFLLNLNKESPFSTNTTWDQSDNEDPMQAESKKNFK